MRSLKQYIIEAIGDEEKTMSNMDFINKFVKMVRSYGIEDAKDMPVKGPEEPILTYTTFDRGSGWVATAQVTWQNTNENQSSIWVAIPEGEVKNDEVSVRIEYNQHEVTNIDPQHQMVPQFVLQKVGGIYKCTDELLSLMKNYIEQIEL